MTPGDWFTLGGIVYALLMWLCVRKIARLVREWEDEEWPHQP